MQQAPGISHTLEPMHKMQVLSAPCDHPSSTMEVHKSWHKPFLQFCRLVEVEFDLEGADMRVCDTCHLVSFEMEWDSSKFEKSRMVQGEDSIQQERVSARTLEC